VLLLPPPLLLPQVCPDFLNAVILREPVPHAISIMAEVKYRYVRQMATKHNIHSWQPTAWNLTWWEALGPSLVGNYATRTLLGRESLCRSAQNMGKQQLDDALDSLLSFDMVMTLGRSQDIDLGITTLLGWPARNFSSQPGARVREVSVDLATKGELAVGDSKASKGGAAVAVSRHLLQLRDGSSSSSGSRGEESNGHGRSLLAVPQHTNKLHNRGAGQHAAAGKGQPGKGPHGALLLKKGNQQQHPQQKKGNNPQQQQQHPQHGKQQRKPQQHQPAGPHPAGGHPAKHGPVHPQPHPKLPSLAGGAGSGHIQHILVVPAVTHSNASSSALSVSVAAGNASAEHLEQQAAVMLVSTTWHERQAELLNLFEKAAVWAITGEPRIEHTGQRTKHGAHVVKVHFRNKAGRPDTEVWHSFPRHTFAFLAADVAKLERLTHLDLQLYQTADLMFDLDTAWLQAMAASSHYRKKLRALAATETSCGFAGMMPVDAKLLKEPAVEEV
jgi:hypothetical protein